MKNSILIHIGPPKTGSTILQDINFYNKDFYKKNDIFIPKNTVAGKGNFDVIKNFDNFLTDLNSSQLNNCILSDEKFWKKKNFLNLLSKIEKIFKNVHIFFVFRNQSDLIFSHFIQQLKDKNSIKDINLFFFKNYKIYSYSEYLKFINNAKIHYSFFDKNFNIVYSYYELLFKIFSLDKNTVYFRFINKRINRTENKITKLIELNIVKDKKDLEMSNDIKKLILRYYRKSNKILLNSNFNFIK